MTPPEERITSEPTFEVRHEHPEGGFAQIPNGLICNGSISTTAKAVYMAIASFAYGMQDKSYPGQATLQAYTGASESTVRRAISELQSSGWLRVQRRGLNRTNIYWLTDRSSVTGPDRSSVTDQEQSRVTGEEDKKKEHKTNNSRSAPSSLGDSKEFSEWLTEYHALTGNTKVRGSAAARREFSARRRENYTVDDLKLCIRGAIKYIVSPENRTPETILRGSNVSKYLLKGEESRPSTATQDPAAAQEWAKSQGF